MSRLILIPARSGSTRVKDKNLRPVGGKSLLARAVTAAREADAGRVILSTNSPAMAELAVQLGAEVPFVRPESLSRSDSSSIGVIFHALSWLEQNEGKVPEIVAFCPPTNPFVRGETIRDMFSLLESRPDKNSVVTIARPKTHPFRIVSFRADQSIQNGVVTIGGKTINDIERSQDWPEVWEGSPACRMTRARYFMDLMRKVDLSTYSGKTYDVDSSLGFPISAREAMDVDDEEDLRLAEALASLPVVG